MTLLGQVVKFERDLKVKCCGGSLLVSAFESFVVVMLENILNGERCFTAMENGLATFSQMVQGKSPWYFFFLSIFYFF
jgi:hypothetical protein